MGPTISVTPESQEPDSSNLDFWGLQIMSAVLFFESGFKTNLEFVDTINSDERVVASDLFEKHGARWFMRPLSIPGNLTVKSIAVDKRALYLETAPLDSGRVREIIEEQMLALKYDASRRVIIDTTNNKVLARIFQAKPNQLKLSDYELARRCMWVIDLSKLDSVRRKAIVSFADLVYTFDAFDSEGLDVGEAGAVSSMRQVQRLDILLQQRLQLEQRPLLSLTATTAVRTELSTQLGVMLGLQQRILSMTEAELLDFTDEYVAKHGEAATIKFYDFVIAGRVKQAYPHLTWREARRLGREATAKLKVEA